MNKDDIPIDFIFLVTLFLISVLGQFVYLILDKRFGAYEPFYFISVVFLFGFAVFLYILLNTDRVNTMKALLYSIVFMIVYQIFQFSAYVLGYKHLTTILNQIDIDKITVFYKIVGSVMGPPSFLSESGMLALYLGPVFGILFGGTVVWICGTFGFVVVG
ncbi:MAG: hypothetical protein K2Q22_03085, partial [Cytophagales bacterium]|nr:hypothetical protein [Cytophagales bacterium]